MENLLKSSARRAAVATAALALGAAAIVPSAALAGGKGPLPTSARITGGGKLVGTASGQPATFTHGLELHCNAQVGPNNLEINWGGNQFHLDALSPQTYCYDDPAVFQGHPAAPANTYVGYGTGKLRLNGTVQTGSIAFVMTDDGEPGRTDRFTFVIADANGTTVAQADSTLVLGGNQQFHFDQKAAHAGLARVKHARHAARSHR